MTPQEVTIRDVLDAELRGVRELIEGLTRQVADGHARSSREHAEVREELRDLRRQIDTMVPTASEFDLFKRETRDRHERLARDLTEVRAELGNRNAIDRWRRWALSALTGCGGLAVSVVALVLTHT